MIFQTVWQCGFVVQGYNAEELEKVSLCAVCCKVWQSFLDSRTCLLTLANLTDPVTARWMQVSERFHEALSLVLGVSASVFPGSEWLSMDIVSVSNIIKHDASAMSTTVTPTQHESFGAALNTTVDTTSTPATRARTTIDDPARNDLQGLIGRTGATLLTRCPEPQEYWTPSLPQSRGRDRPPFAGRVG